MLKRVSVKIKKQTKTKKTSNPEKNDGESLLV